MWLYLPRALTSPSSRESGHLTSPSEEYFTMLSHYATWRTKPQPPSGWRRVWKRETSIRRLFGATSGRSQRDCSEAVSTWLSAASPAPTSASRESAPASTPNAPASSSTSSEPFATYDPATSSWRTSQLSLLEGLTPFSGRWPKAGSMRSGSVFERPTSARLMAEIAGGASHGTGESWATPHVSAVRKSRKALVEMQQWAAPDIEQQAELMMGILPREYQSEDELTPQARRIYDGSRSAWPTATTGDSASAARHTTTTGVMHPGTTLTDAARQWPTPYGMSNRDETGKLGAGGEFAKFVTNWPTPQQADGERQSEWISRREDNPTLLGAARQWQTPKSGGRNAYRGGDRSDEPLLYGQAQEVTARQRACSWSTPAARDYRTSNTAESQARRKDNDKRTQQLSNQASHSGLPAPPTETAGPPSSNAGPTSRPQLSALFVEWLMGVPLGWTCVCAPAPTGSGGSETPSCRPNARQPYASSGSEHSENFRD